MRFHAVIVILAFCTVFLAKSGLAAETGDAAKGREIFRACAACHSLVPEAHMTGPSLAGIWGTKAGSVAGFARYSQALKQADIIWNEDTLDAWLADPRAYIPGNRMTFRGLSDEVQRRNLIAFLRNASGNENAPSAQQVERMPEGMGGQAKMLNLKAIDDSSRVTSISHCGDTYKVTVESGESFDFWEFNLRFKTDSSENGPVAGHPALIPASMGGDRAFVIFAEPSEISPFIKPECPQ